MGWTTGYNSRNEVVEQVTKGWENDVSSTQIVRKFFSGNNLWMVFERHSKVAPTDIEKFIVVALIRCWKTQGGGMDWGYKDVSEEMGPCEVSCPLAFLDIVPDPGGYATAWRARVREFHARRNQKLAIGQTIKLTNGIEYVISKQRGRTFVGISKKDGCEYRIPRAMLTAEVSA